MPFVLETQYRDPLDAFDGLSGDPFAQLLYSAYGSPGGGRYSFVAADPFATVTAKDGKIRAFDAAVEANPFIYLRDTLRRFQTRWSQSDIRIDGNLSVSKAQALLDRTFAGGACGFFSYEMAHYLERIRPRAKDDLQVPDMALGLYDAVAIFDSKDKRAFVVASGEPEISPEARRRRAVDRAHALDSRLKAPPRAISAAPVAPLANRLRLLPALNRAQHIAAIEKAVNYIHAGDIFQANITQRFEGDLPGPFDPYALFRRLMERNPVSYSAYLKFEDFTIVSNSPEQFLKISPGGGSRHVQTAPIKGTIGRAADAAADALQKEKLWLSEKDRAENVMIVDLLRNDLSRVCTDDSVRVTHLHEIESYTHIHHMVSRIEGRLREDCETIDALTACFPGGSVTGAPKIRAMEIISELEGKTRGPYCGAIGYLGFNGAMETNIPIRTLLIKHDDKMPEGRSRKRAYLSVGGGIVADSDPALEYQECLDKVRPFFEALERISDEIAWTQTPPALRGEKELS